MDARQHYCNCGTGHCRSRISNSVRAHSRFTIRYSRADPARADGTRYRRHGRVAQGTHCWLLAAGRCARWSAEQQGQQGSGAGPAGGRDQSARRPPARQVYHTVPTVLSCTIVRALLGPVSQCPVRSARSSILDPGILVGLASGTQSARTAAQGGAGPGRARGRVRAAKHFMSRVPQLVRVRTSPSIRSGNFRHPQASGNLRAQAASAFGALRASYSTLRPAYCVLRVRVRTLET